MVTIMKATPLVRSASMPMTSESAAPAAMPAANAGTMPQPRWVTVSPAP
jgi:hypothetical protein